jgi:N-acetylglucosamine-6-phosphate deacetylase
VTQSLLLGYWWQCDDVPTVAASSIVTRTTVLGPSLVTIDDGRISAIESTNRALHSRTLVPGFVDLQVNGIDTVDCSRADGEAWLELDQLLLRQGVTAWCPTLISAPLDSYAAPLARIAAARADGRTGSRDDNSAGRRSPRPTIIGAHLEGPFLGGAPGAHRKDMLVPVALPWLDALPPIVALMTIAPELDNAAAAIRALVARGTVVSLGHTTATRDEFDTAVAAGASMVTHLFNGMSGLHHREPGVAAFALAGNVSASLIADGIHVDPLIVRLAFEMLGERAMLVTDAVAWRAQRAGPIELRLVDGAPRLADGTLAGSSLTMDAAIRTCVAAGVPLAAAVRAASARPAAVIGRADLGDIAVGGPADFVAIDAALHVEQTWLGGVATLLD